MAVGDASYMTVWTRDYVFKVNEYISWSLVYFQNETHVAQVSYVIDRV
jgi:hypothetical protein